MVNKKHAIILLLSVIVLYYAATSIDTSLLFFKKGWEKVDNKSISEGGNHGYKYIIEDIDLDGLDELILAGKSYLYILEWEQEGYSLKKHQIPKSPITPDRTKNLKIINVNGRKKIIVGNDRISIFDGKSRELEKTIKKGYYDPVNTGDIDLDGDPELIVGYKVLSLKNFKAKREFKLEGSPRQVSVTDLEGDHATEIIYSIDVGPDYEGGDSRGYLYVIDAKTGKLILRKENRIGGDPGFQVLDDINTNGFKELYVAFCCKGESTLYEIRNGEAVILNNIKGYYFSGNQIIEDLNQDGLNEIVSMDNGGDTLYVYGGENFSELASKSLDKFGVISTKRIEDIDGNGTKEIIIIFEGRYSNYSKSKILILDGITLKTIRESEKIEDLEGNDRILDLNRDGLLEVILVSVNQIKVIDLEKFETLWASEKIDVGIPVLGTKITRSAQLDIDNDGEIEVIIIGTHMMILDFENGKYVLKETGIEPQREYSLKAVPVQLNEHNNLLILDDGNLRNKMKIIGMNNMNEIETLFQLN